VPAQILFREVSMTIHPVARHASTLAACALLLAVPLAGCTQKSQSETKSTADATAAAAPAAAVPTTVAAQATTAAAEPAATAAADAAAQPASAPPAAASNPALTSDGSQAGTKFVVNSLVRGSDTVTLKFTLVNASDKSIPGDKFNGSGYLGYRSMSGIHLIDTVSKKKYFPVADTDHNCVCSNDVADIPSNSQTALWVKFPAPPATVKKITIEVPHFIPLDDVPIAS
jgi:hypothetical protein